MKSGSPSRTTAAHKTQTKIQAWSSLLFHCRHSSFNPSEAPPWDSRPVRGAGVVHYHLLHRPRSVPTALGPTPLATYPHRPSQAGGYPRDCALLKKIPVRFPDTLPLGPQPAERLTRGAMRWYWTSLADGDGSSSRGQPAAPPPFPAPPQTWRMAAGSGPLANGADSSAPSRTAATPPRPRSTAASLPSHLLFHCSSTTASGSY